VTRGVGGRGGNTGTSAGGANTGNGGDGGDVTGGKVGGSGVVIIRHLTTSAQATTLTVGTVSTVGDYYV
jgi:hypothetical protein